MEIIILKAEAKVTKEKATIRQLLTRTKQNQQTSTTIKVLFSYLVTVW